MPHAIPIFWVFIILERLSLFYLINSRNTLYFLKSLEFVKFLDFLIIANFHSQNRHLDTHTHFARTRSGLDYIMSGRLSYSKA